MKIITCASYYGSGSSALTDLVAEYSNVKDLSDFEFRFLHDPDGVSDLEYHLCECHNRHNSGHALKRFIRLANYNKGNAFSRRYEPFFENQFGKLTDEYIESLVDFKFKGWWFQDLFDYGEKYYYRMMLLNKILRKATHGKKGILTKELTYCSHPSNDRFLELTRAYVSNLMHAANAEKFEFLEIDQIVPSQNIGRVLRYFEDPITVFVVDRDPRDIYVLEKCYWKGHICPTDDVEKYCKWFRYTRNSGSEDITRLSNVRFIQFEDLIYKYDTEIETIEAFLGLKNENHVNKFKKLNPKRSVANTQSWKKHPELSKDIEYIERELSEYLYPFDNVSFDSLAGIDVKENIPF